MGNLVFVVKHVAPKELPLGSRISAMVFQALRHVGRSAVDGEAIARLRRSLSRNRRRNCFGTPGILPTGLPMSFGRWPRQTGDRRAMDDVARLPAGDRADLFSATAGKRGLRQEILEKDFWACWSFKRLFLLRPPAEAGWTTLGNTLWLRAVIPRIDAGIIR